MSPVQPCTVNSNCRPTQACDATTGNCPPPTVNAVAVVDNRDIQQDPAKLAYAIETGQAREVKIKVHAPSTNSAGQVEHQRAEVFYVLKNGESGKIGLDLIVPYSTILFRDIKNAAIENSSSPDFHYSFSEQKGQSPLKTLWKLATWPFKALWNITFGPVFSVAKAVISLVGIGALVGLGGAALFSHLKNRSTGGHSTGSSKNPLERITSFVQKSKEGIGDFVKTARKKGEENYESWRKNKQEQQAAKV